MGKIGGKLDVNNYKSGWLFADIFSQVKKS